MARITRSFVALLLAAAPLLATADPLDAIVGKWIGPVGTPQDTTEWGIEIRRNAEGAMHGYLYSPVINFYGLDLGEMAFDKGKYVIPGFDLHVALKEGRLQGIGGPLRLAADLHRTDTLPAEGPIPDLPAGPAPRWRLQLGGAIYGRVAVHDGHAYVGTAGGTFNAVSLEDGTIAWAFAAGRPVHGEALVTDEAVYFVCDNGWLFKLDRIGGKELWRYDLGGERVPRVLMHSTIFEWDYRAPRPALAEGVIYAGSADGSFHAIRAGNGERVWKTAGTDRVRNDALIDGNRVVFGRFDGHLVALDRADGRVLWDRATGAPVNASPMVMQGRVIVGNRGAGLLAFDAATGATLWRAFLWGSSGESTAVPYGDRFYVGASDLRRITCYDPRDGRVFWRTDVYGITWATPAVTEKIVYAAAGGFEPYQMRHVGSLSALDRASGRILWRWPAPRGPSQFESGFFSGPVVAGDTLVIGGVDGMLYGFPI